MNHTQKKMNILALSGSLRRNSYNTAALRAAQELAPEGMEIRVFDLAAIPLFNDDLKVQGWPEPVAALRKAAAACDAVLIATPEYNYSIPGILKNAIDWVSRQPDQPFNDKPVAIMGASGGNFGTVRGQLHLRQMLVYLNMHPVNKPEVLIARAQEKFDANGVLTDQATRKIIRELLESLQRWSIRLHLD
jgi:chromate reductase, NAD(P)H dehydrogenase (quinone)